MRKGTTLRVMIWMAMVATDGTSGKALTVTTIVCSIRTASTSRDVIKTVSIEMGTMQRGSIRTDMIGKDMAAVGLIEKDTIKKEYHAKTSC